jgi:hypothetical protein
MVEGTILESRDATFFEDEFPMQNVPSTSGHDYVSLETPEPENIVVMKLMRIFLRRIMV